MQDMVNNTTTQNRKDSRHIGRYRHIAIVLFKYRLNEFIRTLGLESFLPFHWVPPALPWQKDTYSKPQRLRMAMEELGTNFVKVGQILSTRSDVMPSDYLQEFAKLQDSLTPLSQGIIEKVIVDELGRPMKELFSSFEPEPLGVASIGQVHAAMLKDGAEVVVKVQKPGVQEQVNEDIEILRQLAVFAAERGGGWLQYDLPGLVEELSDTLAGELDYIREGHNAEHFARFFQEEASIHIPKVWWSHTTSKVITLERIHGIRVLDLESVEDREKANFDRQDMAKRCAAIWVKMIFEDIVFHSDPHPGNLFIEPEGRLGLVDFGMIGLVDDDVRISVASAVKGMLDRDADILLDSLADLGATSPDSSKEHLRKDVKHLMSHYPLATEDLNLHANLGELFSLLRRNRMRLPGNTFLLLKTMTMAQGLGKRLDPEFDFFALLAPSVENLIRKRYKPSAILQKLPPAFAELALLGAGLPNRLARVLKSVERGELQVRAEVSGVERHLEHLERLVNRAIIGIIIAAIILGVSLVFLAIRMGR
jgi:ubiquinone biosynthesis protein